MRIYGKHKDDVSKNISPKVTALLREEKAKGMQTTEYYDGFQNKADRVKYDLIDFLIKQKKDGKKVAAYGAAAKGNTLLNYCGIKRGLIEFVVDASPYKQGMFLPGSHIPVVKEDEIKKIKPDYVLILPWNIKNEITKQLGYIREWDGRFVVAVPEIKVIEVTR